VIWANDVAQTVSQKDPWNFPYGSVLLCEIYPAVLDSSGNPTLDDNGRYVRGNLTTIWVMRKEQGFGAEYQQIRTGEWEYVAYNPDGSYNTAPAQSGTCALCHQTGSSLPPAVNLAPGNARNDYVFRPTLLFNGGSGAMPDGLMQNYLFVPNTIHVKAGSTVTIYNDDDLVHNIVADDGSFGSDYLDNGASYSIQTDQPGTIAVHCTLHPRMKATIVVDPPDSNTAVPNTLPTTHVKSARRK
jgi:hypothetical protein